MSTEKYSGPRVKDTKSFVEKAIWKHGNKYDYSETTYVNAKTKVKIVCPSHGGFWQIPNNHVSRSGCMDCHLESQIMTTCEFIEKATKVHGEKYDYSSTEYGGHNKDHVKIICTKHGEFWQPPTSHLSGRGCPSCKSEVVGDFHRKSLCDFITQAQDVHEGKYLYDFVEYNNSKKKVVIICPEHGEFKQDPNHHLNGRGCPECAGRYSLKMNNTEWFIHKSKEVHQDAYDYSNVEYVRGDEKVTIVCPVHGSFAQRPADHVKGHGCQKCSFYISGWRYRYADHSTNLYLIKIGDSFLKIGLAVDLDFRMEHIGRGTDMPVELLTSISGVGKDLFEIEQEILRSESLSRYYPEWFHGHTECFKLKDEEEIKNLLLNKAPL